MSSYIDIDTEELLNSSEFILKFNSLYPDLNFNTLDKTIIIDIALEMYHNKIIDLPKIIEKDESIVNIFDSSDKIKEIVQEYVDNKNYSKANKIALNRIKADEIIPELFVSGELLILNGLLNDFPVHIFIDCGATSCYIKKSCVKSSGLADLIDTANKSNITGLNSALSIGKIWYTELIIFDNNLEPIKYPVVLDVIDNISNEFDIILGNNFLRTFNANINFNERLISLATFDNKNNQIEISFV